MNVDLQKNSLAACYGVLAAFGTEYGNFYFRSNCLNRFVGLGWFNKNYATEVQYDFLSKTTGINGQPLFARFGTDHKLSDKSSLNTRFNFG